MQKTKNLILNQIFYVMEQKIDPPNLGFWISYLAQFQIIYAISQKNLLGARETEMLKDKSKAKNKKI